MVKRINTVQEQAVNPNPLTTAVNNNDYPALLRALDSPHNLVALYEKPYPLGVAVKNHNLQIFTLLLNKLVQYKDIKEIKIEHIVSLFAETLQPIEINSPRTAEIIVSAIQTLIAELKNCRGLDQDSPLVGMVKELNALQDPNMVKPAFKIKLNEILAQLIKEYGHSDPAGSRTDSNTTTFANTYADMNTQDKNILREDAQGQLGLDMLRGIID